LGDLKKTSQTPIPTKPAQLVGVEFRAVDSDLTGM